MSADDDAPGSLGRNYWRLWSSAGLSNLADGIFKVALPLIAIQYTRDPTLIAGLAVAEGLPWLVFSLYAGAVSDRQDRRFVMLSANVVRASLLALLALAIALDAATIAVLYVVAFCIGMAETLYDTSAQSILPQVVDRRLLTRANGRLYAAELTANEFIGPPLGGFLVTIGAALVLAGSAGVWFVAAGILLLLRGSFRTGHDGTTTIRADVAEGLRFLRRHRVLRAMALLTGMGNLAFSAAFAVFVLYAVGADSPMGLTEPQYGVLLTATAVGAFLGTFIAERVEKKLGRSRTLLLMIVVTSLAIGVPALTTNPWVIGGVLAASGVTVVLGNVVMVSLRQRVTPDRLLGRVNSAYRLVAWGTMPLGALLGGLVASWWGIRTTFAVAALISLSTLGVMRVLSDANIDAAEGDVE
jgi:MFS family permease